MGLKLKIMNNTTQKYYNYLQDLKKNQGKVTPYGMTVKHRVSANLGKVLTDNGIIQSSGGTDWKWIGGDISMELAENVRTLSNIRVNGRVPGFTTLRTAKKTQIKQNLVPMDKIIDLVKVGIDYKVNDLHKFVKQMLNDKI